MDFSKKVEERANSYTQRDIDLSRNHLADVKEIILRISKNNNGLSIDESIDLFYSNLLKTIKHLSNTDQVDFYKFRVLEYLLKAKNFNSIINNAVENSVYCETSEKKFNGNTENDIKALLKEYYYIIYVYKIQRLREEAKHNPKNTKIVNELNRLIKEKEQLESKSFTVYDLRKFIENQREFFEKLYKKSRDLISKDLCTSLGIKLEFIHEMGWLDKYVKQYNSMLERMYLSSVLKVNNVNDCYNNIINQFKSSKLSIPELLALNAFWTNRFTKEVERINESIYILGRTKKIDGYLSDESQEPTDGEIRKCLAEYRLVVPSFTRYKLKRKEDLREVEILDDKRFAKFSVNANEIFSKSDLDLYGKDSLNAFISSILKLNNYAQLLYDQKDMTIENILSYILNTNEYFNAGYVIQSDNDIKSQKALIAIDLKGYNAPIMLHYHKEKLKDIIKELTGNVKIPVYRGAKDFEEEDQYMNKHVISTNILFPLDKDQIMTAMKRAGISQKSDKNFKYINHIVWLIKPKKDMPNGIYECGKIINLDSFEIEQQRHEKGKSEVE